ncbi:spondin domain-containing protein [Candidatus Micrarchaeota archaeon]|nr:spondin domain-containing protein [Candidatus Micrarchaeota archaeon]
MRFIFALSIVFILLFGCTQTPESSEVDDKLEELEQKLESIEDNIEELEDKVEVLEEVVEEIQTTEPVAEVQEESEEVSDDVVQFKVTIQNVHSSYTLSPGVFVAHKPPASINYVGKVIPSELESLVEYGNNTEFYKYVSELDGVVAAYSIDEPIGPGESFSFKIAVPKDKPRETYFSGLQMIVETNDGFALVNNIALFTSGNGAKNSTTSAQNYDAGTEENSLVGSGFEGGQPDSSKGSENIDNGTPTSPYRPVSPHPQIPKTVMKVIVTPV